jgi:histidinol-phosphate aminotransferase
MSRLVPPHIESLAPYVPGKPIEEVERELGLRGVVKLASNENALGPSPKGIAAARAALERAHLYPDGSAWLLKEALSRKLGVSHDELVIGSGSNDVIELLIRTFLGEGDEAVTSEGTFIIYRLAVQAAGRVCRFAPMKDGHYDLSAIRERVTARTRLVFLANPDNPTGTYFSQGRLEAFLGSVPRDALVVLDEAYAELATAPDYPDSLALRREHPNLVVLRTFSKIYGLAGLRLGYGVCTPEMAGYLNRVRAPFNVSSLALAAGVAALGDDEHLARTRALVKSELPFVVEGLRALDARVLPSQTNFVLADFPAHLAQELFTALMKEGVIVRPMHGYGFATAQRISIGTRPENEKLLAALTKVLRR